MRSPHTIPLGLLQLTVSGPPKEPRMPTPEDQVQIDALAADQPITRLDPTLKAATDASLAAQPHYGGTACKDAMITAFGLEKFIAFCELNAFKYLWRVDAKHHPAENLEKARVYTVWAQEALDLQASRATYAAPQESPAPPPESPASGAMGRPWPQPLVLSYPEVAAIAQVLVTYAQGTGDDLYGVFMKTGAVDRLGDERGRPDTGQLIALIRKLTRTTT